ncbi:MAG TPA: VTT domain-containing protein [Ilumatobacteraceae bacterium]
MAQELVNDLGLIGLFIAALIAASVIPFPLEGLVPLMVAQGYGATGIVVAGTAGGYVGSLVNYILAARGEERWRARNPDKTRTLDRVHTVFDRWGAPVLLLSWLPVIGELMTLLAGVARVRLSVFSFWTIIGRTLRMLGLVHLSFLVF